MTGVNLSRSTQNAEEYTKKSSFLDKGVFLAFLILVFTLLLFGGLKMATKYYSAKKTQVDGETAALRKELASGGVDRVADFQNRLKEIKTNLEAKSNPNELLRQVSLSMVPGSTAELVEESLGAATIKVTVDNYLTAAKQTLALKKSEKLKNIRITEIGKDSDGRIIITLSAQL